jgi:glutathione S-transferase
MSAEVVFYTSPQSRGRIVRRMLEECGAVYRTDVLSREQMKSANYLRLNPMGKVPALVYDGRVVTESAAIIAFLADAYPEAQLAPSLAQRQDYYRWLFFAAGPLEAAVTNKALGVVVAPEQSGFVGYGNYDLVVNTLSEAVTRTPFIAGDHYSAADVFVGSHIDYGLRFRTLPETPALRGYLDRLISRPAWVRAAQLDDALLAPAQ